MTVEIPQPLHPAFKTTTKNRSPKIFKMALTIRKYKGELLSPRARRVAEKKLYKKVKGIGASNLAFGIITLVFGITAGVMLIVNGARLLAHKSDSLI